MTTADPYQQSSEARLAPPTTWWGTLKHLGPGFILSASIVGSGELIATTHLGATAGFVALWVILVSCLVKVAVQLEFGKQAILTGRTTMESLNTLPGPRLGKANWSIWMWLLLMLLKPLQVGAIVGTVAVILSMILPLTSILPADLAITLSGVTIPVNSVFVWSVVAAVVVSLLVFRGDYHVIEKVSLVMTGLFTLLTLVSLFQLQWTPNAIAWPDITGGLTCQLPAAVAFVALGAFGITGVGGDEIMAYNYWLLEKGYARNAGPNEDNQQWADDAKGWIRVMYIDAILAMIVYTVMTVAFFLLGAAILHDSGEVPAHNELVETLSRIYTETLGASARYLFLLGALAVLFSTLLAALAAWTRLYSDAVAQIGLLNYRNPKQRHIAFAIFAWLFPATWVACYFLITAQPAAMVIIGGVATTVILFIVAYAALYFRYRGNDERLKPGIVYDIALWVSSISIAGVGLMGIWKLFFASA